MARATTRRVVAWSFTAGEKGRNRVRVYERGAGTLYLDYHDENGCRVRQALGHTDRNRAKAQAEKLVTRFREEGAKPRAALTLRSLFDMYEREVTPTKGTSAQTHDRRARRLFETCWGANAEVASLDRRDWDRFIQRRRSGDLRPLGSSRTGGQVRDRVIEQHLRFLLAVCNWAETVRENGRPLLDRNPFKGFPIPMEINPSRPIVSDDEFTKFRDAAKILGPDLELYLLLVHETGHRCSAVGRLHWTDVDVADPRRATIRWRPEHDKIGMDHTVPISEDAANALVSARRRAARIGDGWVFPSPTDPEKPVRRDLLLDWWLKLEGKAEVPHLRGRGWHSLRRKFATDLKHDTPLADLCYLGGWKDPQTVLRCYMKADEATMRAALQRRAERLAVSE
jgi:integrase